MFFDTKDSQTKTVLAGLFMVIIGIIMLQYMFKITSKEALKICATALVFAGVTVLSQTIVLKIFRW
ncbi:MAG: hypothetical protein ACTSV7_14865 [Candidatus Baldrarchaeia archaeon]